MLNLALTVETVLYNASIFTSGRIIRGGIAIEDGKIFKIAKEVNLPIATNKIDLERCLAIPGLVDAHTHLRGQMQAYKEDFFTGTSAAVAGGITTLLDMPNNEPVTMDSGSLKQRIKDARREMLGFAAETGELNKEILKQGKNFSVAGSQVEVWRKKTEQYINTFGLSIDDTKQGIGDLTKAGFISRDYTWSLKSGRESRISKFRLRDNSL